MDLSSFVAVHVRPVGKDQFVVKEDLLLGFTDWRQKQQPTMQFSELEKAREQLQDALPASDFKPVLKVSRGSEQASFEECWVGWCLDYQGGRRTLPKRVPRTSSESRTSDKVIWCFHLRSTYSSEPFNTFLTQNVTEQPTNKEAMEALLRKTHARLKQSPGGNFARFVAEKKVFNVFVDLTGSQEVEEEQHAHAVFTAPDVWSDVRAGTSK